MSFSDIDCAGAREAVSAQLDGELAELDCDRLEAHLLLCADCSAWADQVREVTSRLRGVTLEVPAERLAWTRHRRGWRVSSAVALASAAAVVATVLFAPGRQTASPGSVVVGSPRSDATYDVSTGVVYPPHPALGAVAVGVPDPAMVSGLVRPV